MFDIEIDRNGWAVIAMLVVGACAVILRVAVPDLVQSIIDSFMDQINGVSFGFSALPTVLRSFL